MNGKLPVTCPKCHSTGMVPPNFAGHTIHCKKCDSHFVVPAAPPAAPRAEAPHPPEAVRHGLATPKASAESQRPAPRATLPPLSPSAAADHKPAGGKSLLDALSDSGELTPLTPDDEKHARERYEARVLSKDRSAHYDDNGNLISEEELARKNLQKKSHEL